MEIPHARVLEVPRVPSRFVPVDKPQLSSALLQYDISWCRVMMCKHEAADFGLRRTRAYQPVLLRGFARFLPERH